MSHQKFPTIESVRQTLEDGSSRERFIYIDTRYDFWGLSTTDQLKKEAKVGVGSQ